MNIEPATSDQIATIVELDQKYFRPIDLVDEEVFRSWQRKNDSIFTVIRHKKQLLGYYALLPLKQDALKGIIDGTLRERDIKPRDILGRSRLKQCHAIYFFSLVMRRRYSRATLLLLKHLERRLEVLVTEGHLTLVYAIGATPEGQKLLRKLGFQKIKDASERPDQRPLYSRNLSLVREGGESIFTHKF